MKINNMKSSRNTHKLFDFFGQIHVFVVTFWLAVVGFIVLFVVTWMVLSQFQINIIFWGYMILGIYLLCSITQIVRGQIFHYKWYVKKDKKQIACSACGEITEAVFEEDYTIKIEHDPFAPIHQIQNAIQLQKYRPLLHSVCPKCKREEYICPYCSHLISEELLEEHNSHIFICPHCGEKIYTPMRK